MFKTLPVKKGVFLKLLISSSALSSHGGLGQSQLHSKSSYPLRVFPFLSSFYQYYSYPFPSLFSMHSFSRTLRVPRQNLSGYNTLGFSQCVACPSLFFFFIASFIFACPVFTHKRSFVTLSKKGAYRLI
jgi:hypothetical protein